MTVLNYYYFAHISNTYSPKNKLQEAVLEFIQTHNRELVPEGTIVKWMGAITDKIEELNAQYKRCTPIEAYFWQPGPKDEAKDYVFSTGHDITICNFTLLATQPAPTK